MKIKSTSNIMDLLLINPFPEGSTGINEATIEPPLGLPYLAAYVREKGFRVDLIDCNVLRMSRDETVEFVMKSQPRVLGISSNIITHLAGVKILQEVIQSGYKGYTILGGPLPSAEVEFCLRTTQAAAVVVGEGEETLLEILEKIRRNDDHPFAGTRGCVWRKNDEIIHESSRPLIDNLNSLPLPAWDLLPPLRLYKSRARRRPIGAIIASRGCPFQCTYCNKSVFGARYRKYSVNRVIEEVDVLVNKFGIRQLDFLDDNLTLKLDWAKEIFHRLAPFHLAINLQNGIRADYCDEELLDLMRAAGVFKISIGVESGNPEIQRRIKKDINLETIIKITRAAKQRGIIVYGNFIIGLPSETRQTMEDTINFAIRMNPDVATFNCLLPLPGTEVWEEISRDGKLFFSLEKLLTTGFYGSQAHYWLPGMDPDQVSAYYRNAYWRFYGRPSKIWNLMRTISSLGELKWLLESAWGLLHLPRFKLFNFHPY